MFLSYSLLPFLVFIFDLLKSNFQSGGVSKAARAVLLRRLPQLFIGAPFVPQSKRNHNGLHDVKLWMRSKMLSHFASLFQLYRPGSGAQQITTPNSIVSSLETPRVGAAEGQSNFQWLVSHDTGLVGIMLAIDFRGNCCLVYQVQWQTSKNFQI